MTHLLGRCHVAIVCILLAAAAPRASAYNTFPFEFPFPGGTGYLKWGDNHAGTPGGVVTWSLMPVGTTINPAAFEATYVFGTSNLTPIFDQVGGQAAALARIQSALDAWSAVANIQFLYVGIDDGTPFAAPYAPGQVLGNIRIGGFEISGFSAGVGYAAPPNGGTTLEGDIILNIRSDISFYNAPGAEGALFDLYPPGGGFYRNDFGGLITHELGHVLGLSHSQVPSGCMCGYVNEDFNGGECAYYDPDGDGRTHINRLPDPDDAAGAQFLYGPAPNADFNGDTFVDGDDLLVWKRGLGITTGADLDDGDANGDHAVTAADLAIWRNKFVGSATPTAEPIPEPATGALAAITLLAVSSRVPCPRPRGHAKRPGTKP